MKKPAALLIALLCGLARAEPSTATPDGQGLSTTDTRILAIQPVEEPIITVDLTHQAADLWDRIRRGFGMPDLTTPEVNERQIQYLSHPAALRRLFERSYRYMYHIVDALEQRGLPTEIALLPMVESGFNPMAYSRSKAAGLWQFVPSTGRYFNLQQNEWVDERRDVIASTEAALDYLERIYDMHGDWHLALASYNAGEGTVQRAIRRNAAAGRSTEYAHLPLRKETRDYVPKLQALKNILARPELFAIDLPHVPNRTYFGLVESPAGIDLAMAADYADTSLDELVALNPAFRRPVIPAGNQRLALPADKIDGFKARLSDATPRWKTYRLGKKDRLATLAGKFNLSVTQLLQINGLTSPAQARPGRTLLVPAGADIESILPLSELLPDFPTADEVRLSPRRKARRKSR
ncbi:MAG: transglycosylase SLT domain-containing protein [Rhodocyclaceae bacterium]|nr:transglycosylase SLT domain-containing protein [Rhodocyclaceae bacterium]